MESPLNSSTPLIRAQGLGLEIAGRQLLRDITLEIEPAEIVTIIGCCGNSLDPAAWEAVMGGERGQR